MPQFLIQFSYSARSIKNMVDKPEIDRAAEAAGLVASLGGKVLGYWFAFGNYDGVMLLEAPYNDVAASIAMAVGSTGAVSRLETTVLLTMEEAQKAMRKAASAAHLPSEKKESNEH